MILETRAVTARYRGAKRAALDRVSCAVAEAQLVAVVGPNGSGKTTLVRVITGLLASEQGAVLIQGRPVGEWRRSALARVLGVVSQREEVVFPLRVDETVMLGRYARLGALAAPSAGDRAAVQAALERCDVAHLLDRSVDSLSGGEWQRVRIARALVGEPRALVLDEPTASLDVRHEMELFERVRALVDRERLAAVVITHQVNLAARFADRVLLLADGRAVGQGTPGAVLTRETIERVFRWPVAIEPFDDRPQMIPLRQPLS